jgi:hypothetical protein
MISRSNAMVWDAGSVPAEKVRRFTYPVGSEVIRVRLGSASRSTPDPTLIELHPPSEALFPGGTFFCSLELRTRNGWDRGLKLAGKDLSRQALVAHTTQQADNAIVSWYRGQIPVPLEADTDLAPAFTPIVVRVTQVAADLSSVDLEISSSAPRKVQLTEEPGAVVLSTDEHATVLTPCGDELVAATRLWSSGNVYRIRTRGYGGTGTPGTLSPKVTWTVQSQSADQPEGELVLITPSGLTTVTYLLLEDGATLVVLHSDSKSFTTEVVATVSEPDGSRRM